MSQDHLVTTAELIYQIGQLEGKIIHQRLSGLGIRMDHARLLHYVSQRSGTNQVNLAKYLNVQPATLTNMIKKLEKQDLIIRRVDPNDSHQKRVFLLSKGEDAARQVNEVFQELNEIVMSANLDDNGQLRKLFEMLLVTYEENN